MTARQTIPRLDAFTYAVRSVWGFQVIYGETGHGNLEMDWSHDNIHHYRLFGLILTAPYITTTTTTTTTHSTSYSNLLGLCRL